MQRLNDRGFRLVSKGEHRFIQELDKDSTEALEAIGYAVRELQPADHPIGHDKTSKGGISRVWLGQEGPRLNAEGMCYRHGLTPNKQGRCNACYPAVLP